MSTRNGRHIEAALLEIAKILESCDADPSHKAQANGPLAMMRREITCTVPAPQLMKEVQCYVDGWNIKALQKVPEVLDALVNFFDASQMKHI
jgi:hypothetical protein